MTIRVVEIRAAENGPVVYFIPDPTCREAAAEINSLREKLAAEKRESDRLRSVLEGIAGFRLLDFMGPHDMALRCVDVAQMTLRATDTSDPKDVVRP